MEWELEGLRSRYREEAALQRELETKLAATAKAHVALEDWYK